MPSSYQKKLIVRVLHVKQKAASYLARQRELLDYTMHAADAAIAACHAVRDLETKTISLQEEVEELDKCGCFDFDPQAFQEPRVVVAEDEAELAL